KPEVVALSFVAESEVALVRILGEGDDARGAVLPALLGSDPRLAGDLARSLDRAGEASCGVARLDAHGGVDAKRSAFPGDGFAIGDLEIDARLDARRVGDRGSRALFESIERDETVRDALGGLSHTRRYRA